MNIWYFHPYGGAPGFAKYSRPHDLGKEWARAGHTVTVFASGWHHLLDRPEHHPKTLEVDGIRFIAIEARPYSGNGLGRVLNMLDYCRGIIGARRLTEGRPEVVIYSSPHPFGIFPAWWIARRNRAKLVFEVRDIWPLSVTEMSPTPRWHPLVLLAGLAERFAYRRSDLVGSLLGNAEVHMRGRGLAAGKFVHVPNGASPSTTAAETPTTPTGLAATKKLHQWHDEKRLVIIHPGTQGRPSALNLLLDAVSALNAQGHEDRFGVLLVGGGDMGNALQKQTAELGLSNVAIFPPVPKSEALWLTSNSDIGYAGKKDFPTVFKYGISFNKIIDFMQAGLPVILPLTTKGDAVSKSGCGIVTDSNASAIATAIMTMLDMPAKDRASMGERGRQYVHRELNNAAIANTYLDAIKKVS